MRELFGSTRAYANTRRPLEVRAPGGARIVMKIVHVCEGTLKSRRKFLFSLLVAYADDAYLRSRKKLSVAARRHRGQKDSSAGCVGQLPGPRKDQPRAMN